MRINDEGRKKLSFYPHTVPCLIALWSIVSVMTSLVKDYKGLLLVRFFLGVSQVAKFLDVDKSIKRSQAQ